LLAEQSVCAHGTRSRSWIRLLSFMNIVTSSLFKIYYRLKHDETYDLRRLSRHSNRSVEHLQRTNDHAILVVHYFIVATLMQHYNILLLSLFIIIIKLN